MRRCKSRQCVCEAVRQGLRTITDAANQLDAITLVIGVEARENQVMRWWWSLSCLQVLAACGFELSLIPDTAVQSGCSYTLTLAGSPSKYLVAGDRLAWRLAEASCESQQAHLFVPTTDAEVAAIVPRVSEKHWIGLAQPLNQPTQSAGWRLVTGSAHTTMWGSGNPDDGGDVEAGSEQAGTLGGNGLDDDNHRDARPFICECDGSNAEVSIVTMLPL